MSRIARRRFLLSTGALLVAPRAYAQQRARTYRLGAMFGVAGAAGRRYREAFTQRLATYGFVEGGNLVIEAGPVSGTFHEDRQAAAALLAAKPDAMFTCMAAATEAAHAASKSVPLVFTWLADPVASGLLKNYAKPGGNVTGVTNRFPELLLKRPELMREMLPKANRVVVLGDSAASWYLSHRPAFHSAATRRGIEMQEFRIADGVAMWKSEPQAILMLYHFALFPTSVAPFLTEATKRRVPAIFPDVDAVEAGGLLGYGTNLVDEIQRGADLLARVLKGAKPGDLPVDQSARFELAVNLKTAKALGVTIPQTILLRADKVIE